MKKIRFALLALLTLSLTACDAGDLFSSLLSSCSNTNTTTDEEGKEATNAEVTLAKYWSNLGYKILPSTGEQKMLVIPLNFEGDNLKYQSTLSTKTVDHYEPTKDELTAAFFGSTEDTGWESVSSFYNKSSYGKLNITGVVTDPYVPDIDVSTLAKGEDQASGLGDPTWYILRSAVEWVRNNCSDINLKDYDQNQDGFIDSVFLIYNVEYNALPSTIDKNSVFWAYTFWDYSIESNLAAPTANVYGWASSAFLEKGDYDTNTDAHTYIHETGHILGLDDYYTYDSNDYGAIGGLDMMDYNIGDHDAYTKSMLGWTTPTYINKEGTYTLRPFESSGDCIVIRPNWKGSLLDEYLILEYYTPTGLNKQDAETTYPGKVKLYEKSGLKVLHVDARLIKTIQDSSGNKSNYGYMTNLTNTYNSITKQLTYTEFAASNTYSKSYSGYKQVSLVDGNVKNESKNRLATGDESYAKDSFLFHATSNNKFGLEGERYEGFTFHSGLELDYGFTITSANSSELTLEFTKL